jgi:hypothetical protein
MMTLKPEGADGGENCSSANTILKLLDLSVDDCSAESVLMNEAREALSWCDP